MKVVMTADAVGGVWTYVTGLCEALPDVEFVVVTFGPRPTERQAKDLGRLPNVTLQPSDWRLEWMPESERDVAASCRWLRELVDEEVPDLLHVNGYAHAALDWNLPVVLVAHSCVWSWWRAVHGTRVPPEWASYGARVATALGAASRVIVPTRAFLRDLCTAHGSIGAAQVIHNGMHFDHAMGVRLDPHHRYEFIIGAGRSWDPAKNLHVLDQAAAAVRWPVYVAGPNREPGRAQSRCTQHALHLGELPHDELKELLGRAAIFAAPAVYEPFGLSILEAAAGGCALVLGDIPTLRELWDGVAIFVPPREPRRLAAALNLLIEEHELRTSLAHAAATRARQFPMQRTALAYQQLYTQLLSQPAQGRARAHA